MMHRGILYTAALLSVHTAYAQGTPALNLGGYFFGDYFHKLAGDSAALPAQYAPYVPGSHAIQFRRIYCWITAHLASRFRSRFLLEANERSLDSQGRYAFFLKEASLTWDSLGSPWVQAQLGLIPTPTWRLAEQLWGYRSLEKTLVDFWGWGTAVDFGISFQFLWHAGQHQRARLTTMLGSGNGVRAETDKPKKLYASLAIQPLEGLWMECYADRDLSSTASAGFLLKGFVGYSTVGFRGGIESLVRRQSSSSAQSTGAGLFAAFQLSHAPELWLVARYDNVRTNAQQRHHFGLVGLDYAPIAQVRLMPNIWLLHSPQGTSGSPQTHVVARLSWFVQYP
jgi:hypothetical protein